MTASLQSTNAPQNPRGKPSFFLLFLLISFGSVSAVLFTPALPAISQYFEVGDSAVGLTITLFLIGYALGQLLYGPLANGLGRKRALYIGITGEIVASLLCIYAGYLHAFGLLVFARLLMALGASVGLKMSFTLVADSWGVQEGNRIISHLTIAFAITPGLGVALGGLLTEFMGWQSCFYALAIYGLFLLYLTYHMPETAPSIDKNALKFRMIVKKYVNILKNTRLLYGALLMGTCTAFVYLFAAIAPFLAAHAMHLNPTQYGLWNLLPPIGILLGSQLAAYFAQRFSLLTGLCVGLVIVALGTFWMFGIFWSSPALPIGLFLPSAFIYLGISLIFPNASSQALHSCIDKSSASAMMNCINVGVATICVLLSGMFNIQSNLFLPLFYIILTSFIFLLIIILCGDEKKL